MSYKRFGVIAIAGGLLLAGCAEQVSGTASPADTAGTVEQTTTSRPRTTTSRDDPGKDDIKALPDLSSVLNQARVTELLKDKVMIVPGGGVSPTGMVTWRARGEVNPPGVGYVTYDLDITGSLMKAIGRSGIERAREYFAQSFTRNAASGFVPAQVAGADEVGVRKPDDPVIASITYAIRVRNLVLEVKYHAPGPTNRAVPTPVRQSEELLAKFVQDLVKVLAQR
ncbi:hypothetical protein EV193_108157 [Herbihabitans rhizosphaerae]|uniref:Lipoprotein n=1 Tax=Herbihabitans rhizosphaerae TaxID=1872711 RepID=A0A4Q7KIP8_9PSEU|nr:hypothetical protein [Herbihabitans rhizosphaerae]RZS34808.1 hypothetical protein EV193_108157 [Herbihabitans rhizosphaerae]